MLQEVIQDHVQAVSYTHLMYALQENVAKYERNFGPIRMPEEMNGANGGPDGKTFIPPMSGFCLLYTSYCISCCPSGGYAVLG